MTSAEVCKVALNILNEVWDNREDLSIKQVLFLAKLRKAIIKETENQENQGGR